ncbi:flagellar assembly protein FliW [Geobacillus sp. G4]|uniref:flagellar assembly protein FliW n=1 Tax=Geobacillus TaxID=129337 RepID=UPI00049EA579|nr:flagellar assembly protein FliW [Geobacillus thermoleovorans]AKM20409.1 Flagellar assembly factor FliW [Geobacillus sp. 12AMOR1]KDE46044.1 flagellar assembly protein FliW [Geobacillus sp. CAMR12739]UPT60637.1 flagellar assembly protein FliW [Geobacillus thermoleovorans]STO13701.1 Flagellar assembly factor FliW [[Flavobacterium] thermophilum]
MNIDTKYHGTVAVKEEDIIHFPHGLPGFADEKRFVLLPLADTPFVILQSVEIPALGFVLIEPFSYFPSYEFELDEATVEQLNIESERDVAVYVILTVADPFHETTANLQAPVVINVHKRLGKQVILTNPPYQTKHRLFPDKVAT